MAELMEFPEDFIWGVATSAQQIEGGRCEGGRKDSIWDSFADEPGNIEDGSTPAVACDHYNRWAADVELMKWLGVDAYRLSISWPRILPEGTGGVNQEGLDFYDALVDALLESGIFPFITLNHWDLPRNLQDRGGWGKRETAEAFTDYSMVVSRRLGDRVRYWTTHNEPWVIATLGHETGEHAPGHQDPEEALRVSHHLLLSHGWAARELRNMVQGARVGIVLNIVPARPASDDPADIDAARQLDGSLNRWYLDPVLRGSYPEDAVEDRVRRGHLDSPEMPFVNEGDMKIVSADIDFLGINYYTQLTVKAGAEGEPVPVRTVPEEQLTDMGWEICPEALYNVLVRVKSDYNPKQIFITENGAAYPDTPDREGRVHDSGRINYIKRHLHQAHRAIADGVKLSGYFAWSLMDNFEWAHGYTRRFGLFRVEFDSGKRYPKKSAYYFRNIIEKNAVKL